ncbi:MAG: ABC transporter substrate-binding protein [Ilumatobacteraceae bacterium]
MAFVAALVVAACGDDDDGGGSDATTAEGTAEPAGSAATEGTAASEETTAPEGTTATANSAATDETTAGSEEGEGEAAEGVTPIDTTRFGLVDGIYKAGDFELDPADCPDDWDPMQGITDTDITFFSSLPMSGPVAGFGLIADGINSYFEYVNENGGIDGVNVHLEAKDDGYAPDKTVTNVDEALGSGSYAGAVTIIGTPNNLAVWDVLNDECMPQLLNGTGAPQWGDIDNHPWTTGMQLDYISEAGLWAEWLQSEHPDATTVAAITYNNDFGKAYEAGFEAGIEGTDIEVVAQEFHEPTAPELTNQFTTMAASGADVLLIETTGAFCTQAMAEVEKNPDWNPIVIMSGTCQSLSQFFQPLIDQGLTGEGTHIMQYAKDVNDVAFADEDFVKLFHETATAQGLDSSQTTYATGWLFAWYLEHILKTASTFEGGLDRGNIALAARFVSAANPLVLDGVTQYTDGYDDAYLVEGGQMAEYQVTDPGTVGTLTPVGDLVDNNGSIGTYTDFQESAGG